MFCNVAMLHWRWLCNQAFNPCSFGYCEMSNHAVKCMKCRHGACVSRFKILACDLHPVHCLDVCGGTAKCVADCVLTCVWHVQTKKHRLQLQIYQNLRISFMITCLHMHYYGMSRRHRRRQHQCFLYLPFLVGRLCIGIRSRNLAILHDYGVECQLCGLLVSMYKLFL